MDVARAINCRACTQVCSNRLVLQSDPVKITMTDCYRPIAPKQPNPKPSPGTLKKLTEGVDLDDISKKKKKKKIKYSKKRWTKKDSILQALNILQNNAVEGLEETITTTISQECIDKIRKYVERVKDIDDMSAPLPLKWVAFSYILTMVLATLILFLVTII